MRRRLLTAIAATNLAMLAAFAPSAVASHAGVTADCGSAGAFTVKAQPNNGGFQSPAPDHVILFEEGGVLTVQQLFIEGQLVLTRAATGSQENAISEVTCTFTIGDGATFRVIGILAGTR